VTSLYVLKGQNRAQFLRAKPTTDAIKLNAPQLNQLWCIQFNSISGRLCTKKLCTVLSLKDFVQRSHGQRPCDLLQCKF